MSGRRSSISAEEMEFNFGISRRVEEARLRSGRARPELARAMGIGASQLFAYEAGVARWPVFRLQQIARELGVELEELIPG